MIDDIDLRRRLLDELAWDPSLDATHVGVTASHGVVTLVGHVSSYAALFAARRLARRVEGVRAVADELVVELPAEHERDDEDIAASIVHVLESNVSPPSRDVRAEVRDGIVSLYGEVEWQLQRRHVESQVAHVGGVRAIHNLIKLRVHPRPDDVELRIERALARRAGLEAGHVSVTVEGDTVRLGGTVRALRERALVESAAWDAPGVREVIDEIEVVC